MPGRHCVCVFCTLLCGCTAGCGDHICRSRQFFDVYHGHHVVIHRCTNDNSPAHIDGYDRFDEHNISGSHRNDHCRHHHVRQHLHNDVIIHHVHDRRTNNNHELIDDTQIFINT